MRWKNHVRGSRSTLFDSVAKMVITALFTVRPLIGFYSKGRLLTLPTNIRLGWKLLFIKNGFFITFVSENPRDKILQN